MRGLLPKRDTHAYWKIFRTRESRKKPKQVIRFDQAIGRVQLPPYEDVFAGSTFHGRLSQKASEWDVPAEL